MAETVLIHQVSQQFTAHRQALQVLDQVQLSIDAGEFVAVLGPSGCGKSTLLRLIAGLAQPSAGAVRLGNRLVASVDARCALMFQEPRLLPWKTIAANVALGARQQRRAANPAALLELVGLGAFGQAYPHQLSGGMAQRAALARALIGQPGVLLLDEPFAALDALTRMQMQDLVATVYQALRPTVVMVTHDIDEALYLSDRIVLMSARPATITQQRVVGLARPRDRGHPHLAALRTDILAHFGFAHGVVRDTGEIYSI